MDEEFTPEDLAWINEPFTKKDLEYIEAMKQQSKNWIQQKREI